MIQVWCLLYNFKSLFSYPMTPVTCFVWFEYTLDKSMFCGLYPLCLVMGNSLYPFGLLNVILSPNKEIIIQSNQLLKIKATYFWEIHFILSFTAIYIISFTNDQMPYCLPIISLNGENILKFAHNVRNKLFRYLIHKAKIIWQKIFFFFFFWDLKITPNLQQFKTCFRAFWNLDPACDEAAPKKRSTTMRFFFLL